MKNLLFIIITCSFYFSSTAQNSTKISIGNKVKPFITIDDTGKTWSSASVSSDFLVVYFYPAAMTGGCTKQACAYRDNKTYFDKLNTTVIGISGDKVEGLKHFKESYQLNFPLLSDSEGKLSKLFGVPTTKGGTFNKEFNGKNFILTREITTPRWTFILNKEREIIYKNTDVNASDDSKIVKEFIEKQL